MCMSGQWCGEICRGKFWARDGRFGGDGLAIYSMAPVRFGYGSGVERFGRFRLRVLGRFLWEKGFSLCFIIPFQEKRFRRFRFRFQFLEKRFLEKFLHWASWIYENPRGFQTPGVLRNLRSMLESFLRSAGHPKVSCGRLCVSSIPSTVGRRASAPCRRALVLRAPSRPGSEQSNSRPKQDKSQTRWRRARASGLFRACEACSELVRILSL